MQALATYTERIHHAGFDLNVDIDLKVDIDKGLWKNSVFINSITSQMQILIPNVSILIYSFLPISCLF